MPAQLYDKLCYLFHTLRTNALVLILVLLIEVCSLDNEDQVSLRTLPALDAVDNTNRGQLPRTGLPRSLPPDPVTELYRMTADHRGHPIGSIPMKASLVMGILAQSNKVYLRDNRLSEHTFVFDWSDLHAQYTLLKVDVHFYIQRIMLTSPQIIYLRLHMCAPYTDINVNVACLNSTLLDVKRVPFLGSGWVKFSSIFSRHHWNGEVSRQPLVLGVYLVDTNGRMISSKAVTVVARQPRFSRYQPCLLLFLYSLPLTQQRPVSEKSTWLGNNTARDTSSEAYPFKEFPSPVISGDHLGRFPRSTARNENGYTTRRGRRKKGGEDKQPRHKPLVGHPEYCSLHKLLVPTNMIAYGHEIISPTLFDASICRGRCPFPITERFSPTSHATLQMLLHIRRLKGLTVPPTPCTSIKWGNVRTLYYKTRDKVVVHDFKNIRVTKCGCR